MKKTMLFTIGLAISFQAVISQDFPALRERMVKEQIEARGISHGPTLEAMRKVKRHLFVPLQYRKHAYQDTPLPIGKRQTISQPFIVARMTQALSPGANEKVLEIGTGSGYQAAVLAEIVDEVFTIEIVEDLGTQAREKLEQLGYNNVHVVIGDGYQGLEEEAPFDAIIVTAAAGEIPPPLIRQLGNGGRLIIPQGPPSGTQTLVLLEKKGKEIIRTELDAVRFVPFTRNHE